MGDWRQNLDESGLCPFPEEDPPLGAPSQGRECLDGPYKGFMAVWLIGESRVLLRDIDGKTRPAWYELVECGNLRAHAPRESRCTPNPSQATLPQSLPQPPRPPLPTLSDSRAGRGRVAHRTRGKVAVGYDR